MGASVASLLLPPLLIMKANHLPKHQKLLLRKLMFNRITNDSLINECLDKYNFKIKNIDELDNDLPLYYKCNNITDNSVKMLGLVVAYAPSRQDLFQKRCFRNKS